MKKRYTIILFLILSTSLLFSGCFGGTKVEDINMQILDAQDSIMDFNSNNIQVSMHLKNIGGNGKFYLEFYIDKNQSNPDNPEEIVKAAKSKIYVAEEDFDHTLRFDIPTDYGYPTYKITKITVYSIGVGITDVYKDNIDLK